MEAHATWTSIVTAASEAYQHTDGHALRFARSKLNRDRVFRYLLERGLIKPGATVLDIGCGQGLLASLLCAAASVGVTTRWPPGWAAAPLGAKVIGFDVRACDVARAASIASFRDGTATFILGDMRRAKFPRCDVAVFFDSLHYIAIVEQDEVLRRAREALNPGGVILLRVGDTSAPLRYRLGAWIDRMTMSLHGGGMARVHGRPLAAWNTTLTGLGLDVQSCPMNGRGLFANRLIVATARA